MNNLIKAIVMILLAALLSCSDKIGSSTTERSTSYTYEIDNNYRIYKIIYIDENNNRYATVFEYTERTVKELSENGKLVCTYYLNDAGIADSSSKSKYVYSSVGYLLTELTSGTAPKQHEYFGGNRIRTTWGTNKIYYQFNSLNNLLDIEHSKGSFLGKLNKNLVSSVRIQFPMASNGTNTNYSYQMNSEGLVIKRTGITTYNYDDHDSRTVTTFTYIKH